MGIQSAFTMEFVDNSLAAVSPCSSPRSRQKKMERQRLAALKRQRDLTKNSWSVTAQDNAPGPALLRHALPGVELLSSAEMPDSARADGDTIDPAFAHVSGTLPQNAADVRGADVISCARVDCDVSPSLISRVPRMSSDESAERHDSLADEQVSDCASESLLSHHPGDPPVQESTTEQKWDLQLGADKSPARTGKSHGFRFFKPWKRAVHIVEEPTSVTPFVQDGFEDSDESHSSNRSLDDSLSNDINLRASTPWPTEGATDLDPPLLGCQADETSCRVPSPLPLVSRFQMSLEGDAKCHLPATSSTASGAEPPSPTLESEPVTKKRFRLWGGSKKKVSPVSIADDSSLDEMQVSAFDLE